MPISIHVYGHMECRVKYINTSFYGCYVSYTAVFINPFALYVTLSVTGGNTTAPSRSLTVAAKAGYGSAPVIG